MTPASALNTQPSNTSDVQTKENADIYTFLNDRLESIKQRKKNKN